MGLPKVRSPSRLDHPHFGTSYRNALAGSTAAKISSGSPLKPGSFRWLCVSYYSSAEFKLLSDRTRSVRKRILDKYCQSHGDKPFGVLQPRHIRALRDALADRPEAANQFVKLLRQVLSFAVEYDYMEHNPAKDVPYITSNSQGFHTWTVEEVSQYEAAHPVGTTARLALALLLYTGQRRRDVVDSVGSTQKTDG